MEVGGGGDEHNTTAMSEDDRRDNYVGDRAAQVRGRGAILEQPWVRERATNDTEESIKAFASSCSCSFKNMREAYSIGYGPKQTVGQVSPSRWTLRFTPKAAIFVCRCCHAVWPIDLLYAGRVVLLLVG